MNSAGYIYIHLYICILNTCILDVLRYILNFCRFGDGDGDDYVEKLSTHCDQLFCFKYIRFWIYHFLDIFFFGYIIFWIYLFLDISFLENIFISDIFLFRYIFFLVLDISFLDISIKNVP